MEEFAQQQVESSAGFIFSEALPYIKTTISSWGAVSNDLQFKLSLVVYNTNKRLHYKVLRQSTPPMHMTCSAKNTRSKRMLTEQPVGT